jgi:hypothetical protein
MQMILRNGADYLPLQVQLRSSRDRSFASWKRYFGYNGASYLPLQVQLRSSRDRSFASCKRSLWPHSSLRREHSGLHASVLCMYICMKACMKVSFCMKASTKMLAKIMQRTSIDQILNSCGEIMRCLKIQWYRSPYGNPSNHLMNFNRHWNQLI